MSHTTIYFLTPGEDYDDAESKVDSHLDSEHFFDYFNVLKEESGTLSDKKKDLTNFLNGYEHGKAAEENLQKAQECKEKGEIGPYGYYLICAGELYAQNLTVNTYVYNPEYGDYTIPNEDSGWWLIAVDFHY